MKVWFSLQVHTEIHDIPENISNLVENVLPRLKDDYGCTPTFYIQVEPPECNPENIFKQYPEQVKQLASYGEIGLHSHFIHDCSPQHQIIHIRHAVEQGRKYNPVSWVSGDWLTDNQTLLILSSLGLKIDSSVVQGFHNWISPTIPYYPSSKSLYKVAKVCRNNILEVPNTARLRLSMSETKQHYYTEAHINSIRKYREEIPVILPCHSYDFVKKERYWTLLGYLLWLTENFDVKMVTTKDYMQYPILESWELMGIPTIKKIRREIFRRMGRKY